MQFGIFTVGDVTTDPVTGATVRQNPLTVTGTATLGSQVQLLVIVCTGHVRFGCRLGHTKQR